MKIQINGTNIDYRDSGSGLPVVFIHAFPVNQTMWDEQLSALRGTCRTITLDLRGFGNSDVTEGPYSMEQMASDVNGLMSALSIEQAVLVGLSMGGYISLAFYRKYPGGVLAMVLADTRAAADTHAARERRLKSAEQAERAGTAAIADEMVPMLLAESTIASHADIVQRVRSMIEANSPTGIAAAQRGMAARPDSTYILPAIDCPVLVLVGSEDHLTPISEAEAIRNGIRGAKLKSIEGAGHMSNIERPAEFNRALIEFVKGVQGK